jgi:hypothetical protein
MEARVAPYNETGKTTCRFGNEEMLIYMHYMVSIYGCIPVFTLGKLHSLTVSYDNFNSDQGMTDVRRRLGSISFRNQATWSVQSDPPLISFHVLDHSTDKVEPITDTNLAAMREECTWCSLITWRGFAW